MLLSFVAFGLLFAWLLVHRYRVEVLEDRFEEEGFAVAIAERRAEGAVGPQAAVLPGGPQAAVLPVGPNEREKAGREQ
jgi:hypothetical protein